MPLTSFALWLNDTFSSFDYAILEFYHILAQKADFIINPVMTFMSIIGDKALFSFALTIAFLLFPKTRKAGICMLLAILCGVLITNVALKELVARPRPFLMGFEEWWQLVGAQSPNEYSFPSGHATAAMSAMCAMCLSLRKKSVFIFSTVYVALMCAARNYLMVHYPTDVIGGVIAGAIAAFIAFFLTKLIYRLIDKNESASSFFATADIRNLFKKKAK